MLISRCAWHRRYHGYTKVLGIGSWRGLYVTFTDGICQKCAARVRADHLRARYDRAAPADRRRTAWGPGLAAVSLGLVVALVLIARPIHEPPVSPVIAVLPPPTSATPPSRADVTAGPVDTADMARPADPAPVSRSHPEPRVVREPAPSVVRIPEPGIAERVRLVSARLSALPRLVVVPAVYAGGRVPPPRYAAQSP